MEEVAYTELLTPKTFQVTIYYEDTDFTGWVYHPNFLRYLERARSEFFGVEVVRWLTQELGYSLFVHRIEMVFSKPAAYGDRLEILSKPHMKHPYRLVFEQEVRARGDNTLLVRARTDLGCLDRGRSLVPIPLDRVLDYLKRFSAGASLG